MNKQMPNLNWKTGQINQKSSLPYLIGDDGRVPMGDVGEGSWKGLGHETEFKYLTKIYYSGSK